MNVFKIKKKTYISAAISLSTQTENEATSAVEHDVSQQQLTSQKFDVRSQKQVPKPEVYNI